MLPLLLLLSTSSAYSLKILGYAPIAYHSHANFIGKIGDVLAEAGHEVVMLSPVLHLGLPRRVSKHARTIHFRNDSIAAAFTDFMDNSATPNLWTVDNTNSLAIIEPFGKMFGYMGKMCESIIGDVELIQQLRDEHFDVAYGETLDRCAFALFHLAGITKFAVTQSLSVFDSWEHFTGIPHFTSYVPGMLSSYSDRMSMYERARNTLDAIVLRYATHRDWAATQAEIHRLHPGMPPVNEMAPKASYFFVNAEPLMDFPRLVSRKVIDIGGISVPVKHHPLGEPFSSWLAARPHTVLISFGTIMYSSMMPPAFKATILETARRLPNVTFIWKYEKEEDNIALGIPNLHTSSWLPQSDLIHDGRLSLFVTHGGLGSTNEATYTGVPLVVLPVMGDQMRNGHIVKRLGNGVLLHRDDLGDVDKFESTIRGVLESAKYGERAKRVAAMLAAQPFPVRARLVSHFEFMAAFGPLDTLNLPGRSMGFIELFNLDIIALAVSSVAAISLFIVYFLYKIFSTFMRIRVVQKQKIQ